jgi:hypothetical protein
MRLIIMSFLWLWMLFVPESFSATTPFTPIASSGQTIIKKSSGTFNVRAVIKMHEVDIGKPSTERPDKIRTNCTYSRYPCSLVDYIDITANGKPVFVNRSVFADLADLNRAEIKIDGQKAILIIEAGDASESYVLKILFDAERVIKREMFDGESGNSKSQETNYYQVTLD